jgi:hypothetical protein
MSFGIWNTNPYGSPDSVCFPTFNLLIDQGGGMLSTWVDQLARAFRGFLVAAELGTWRKSRLLSVHQSQSESYKQLRLKHHESIFSV